MALGGASGIRCKSMLVELAVQRAQYLFDSVQFLSCGNLENGSLGRNVFFFYEVGFIAGIKKMQKVTKVRRGKNFKLLCTRYIPRTNTCPRT